MKCPNRILALTGVCLTLGFAALVVPIVLAEPAPPGPCAGGTETGPHVVYTCLNPGTYTVPVPLSWTNQTFLQSNAIAPPVLVGPLVSAMKEVTYTYYDCDWNAYLNQSVTNTVPPSTNWFLTGFPTVAAPVGTNTYTIGVQAGNWSDCAALPWKTVPITIVVLADADQDGLPDEWELKYFGNLNHSGYDLDANGNTLLDDYQNGTEPDIASAFSIEATNDYVNHTNVSVQLDITDGAPADYAIFIEGSATTNWLAFGGTNLSINLGTTDGVYTVVVGLKGIATNATESWQDYSFTLDRVAPVLVITNPILVSGSATVIKPYLQLQGLADEPLSSLSYDLTNALGLATNLDAFVTDQSFDTNRFDFTTNYFQAYDVPLATNDNWITVRVTDRAGNSTSTNMEVVLDYTGATNPIIRLTWPKSGKELCGNDFTVRGWTDDESASVQATIISTNETTNIISGEVERTGVLWAEHLPLSPGTNWVTLVVTNAAGLASKTNFYVVKSDMTFALTQINGSLWQPTASVSGVISDPNAPVWVNGVSGTNNGDGTWSADGVPVSQSGVASFDYSTIPPGQDDPLGNTNVDKPVYWGIEEYHVNKTDDEKDQLVDASSFSSWSQFDSRIKDYYAVFSTNISTAALGIRSYMGTIADYNEWTYCTSNGSTYINSSGWAENDYMWSDIDGWWSGTNSDGSGGFWPEFPYQNDNFYQLSGVPDQSLWEFGGGGYPYNVPPKWIYHYFANNVHHHWHWNFTSGGYKDIDVTVTARTKVKLFTGGKAKVGRQSLFCIEPTAQEIGRASEGYWLGAPVTDLPKDRLRVLGKWVGADGKLWVALPDNSEQDITVVAPAKHYDAWENVTKYPTWITANQFNLETNVPEFCVGQKVTFTLEGLPLGDIVDMKGGWVLPPKYVNEKWQNSTPPIPNQGPPMPYGSVNYRINSDLLENTNQTSCWYVNQPAGNMSVGLNLKFSNGQYASVARSGEFTVYMPEISFFTNHPPFIPMVTNGWVELGLDGYVSADPHDFSGCMNFNCTVKSKSPFPGYIIWTQLINRQVDWVPIHSTSGFELDNDEVFNGSVYVDMTNSIDFVDNPGISDSVWWPCVNISDHFKTYLRFEPDTPNDNIQITLGVVTWSWGASSCSTPAINSTNVVAPALIPSDEFPEWLDTIHASTGQ